MRHLLSDGIQALIKNQGFYMKVYPTHRTQALQQWIYDNIKLNVTRTTVQNGSARLGFNDGYGGYPFPILSSDPAEAGAHGDLEPRSALFRFLSSRWTSCEYVVASANGQPVLSTAGKLNYRCDFYQRGKTPAETGYQLQHRVPERVRSSDQRRRRGDRHHLHQPGGSPAGHLGAAARPGPRA